MFFIPISTTVHTRCRKVQNFTKIILIAHKIMPCRQKTSKDGGPNRPEIYLLLIINKVLE
jgi:hypothetical protein